MGYVRAETTKRGPRDDQALSSATREQQVQPTRDDGLPVVIIGAGPSGLTAAYALVRENQKAIVLEAHSIVGGLARTESYKGFCFDIGGHRFLTKSAVVDTLWRDMLKDDFVRRPRLSRIYYNHTFFKYPLKPFNVVRGLGLLESAMVFASYLRVQFTPHRRETTFKQWVQNRFGHRIFRTFFKSYTEKVWGIPCTELRAEWAAQRIENLSLKSIIFNMLRASGGRFKTLTEEFDYPRRGPGMMWNAFKDRVEEGGCEVRMECPVVRLLHSENRIRAVEIVADGKQELVKGRHFISSMAITDLVKRMDPPPPKDILESAHTLRYRDFVTVCLILKKADPFPDNWIYVHDPAAKVGRIQNYKNWSQDMVPDPTMSSVGMEYFCNEGDELWSKDDAELVELGKRELEILGLARAEDVVDGCVFRAQKAYPVYDAEYKEHLDRIRTYIEQFENLQTVGRNGLHRYNNQDHAMLTGLYAVRNLLFDEKHDIWSVNADEEYLEHDSEAKPDVDPLEQQSDVRHGAVLTAEDSH